MTTIPAANPSADQAVAGVRALAAIDGAALLRALEAVPPDVYFDDAADVLGWVERFVPLPALTIAADACILLAEIARAYETGRIKSADPQDPAMLRAAGPDNVSLGG